MAYPHGEQSLGWRQVKDELRQVQTPYYRSLLNHNNGRWAETIGDSGRISISKLKQT